MKLFEYFENIVIKSNIIKELKEYKFSEPPTVKVIDSNQVITSEKAKKLKK